MACPGLIERSQARNAKQEVSPKTHPTFASNHAESLPHAQMLPKAFTVDSMTVRPLIHIGYHKTGTSYLQSEFFTENYGFQRWPSTQRALHPVFTLLGSYDQPKESDVQELRRLFAEAGQRNQTFVVSHERISGHPSSGGLDAKLIADRLLDVFPDARVLIIIREQEAMIRSAYSQFVTEGGSLNLRRYLTPPQPDVLKRPHFSLHHFEYEPAIRYYQRRVGEDNVLVMPFELFVAEPAEFLNRLGNFARSANWENRTAEDFASERVNVARKVATQTLRRVLNACLARTQFSNSGWLNFPKLIRLYEKLSPKVDWLVPSALDRWIIERQKSLIRSSIGDYYAPFNRRLCELLNTDLGQLGYRV